MEKNTDQDVRRKMITSAEWHVTYHTEKLAEYKMQLQILQSTHNPQTESHEQTDH